MTGGLRELAESIRAGERSAQEVARESLAAIEERDGRLSAFQRTERELALSRAAELDRELARGRGGGPLTGVPFALKANLCAQGFESDCGSRILAGWRAPYTATAVQRLIDAGAVPVGVTRMDEFGMGSSGENSPYPPSCNPWDPGRSPGGSSSGSAVAVAAGMVPLALGTDTGGSVRQPAAFCGISGFKPTYGRVSRYGLVAFGSSLDQVGPLARSAADLEIAMGVLSGHDPRDSTSIPLGPMEPEVPAERASLDGMRIGVARKLLPEGLDPGVRARVEEAVKVLAAAGAEILPVELPHSRHALPTYHVVANAEASSNLARFDGLRYGARVPGEGGYRGALAASRGAGFGDEVKRRILLGTFALSRGYREAWYRKALQVRRLLAHDFERAFERVDLIAAPTAPTPAFELGEKKDDPLAMYAADVLTVPQSLAGLPAVSVPCGLARADGVELPVGLQIAGPALGDARVLRAARAFQARTDHHRREPPAAREPEGA